MGKKAGGKKGSNAKRDAKKEAKKAVQAAIVKQGQTLKAALSAVDPLQALPPMFHTFTRNGVDGTFEFTTYEDLESADRLTDTGMAITDKSKQQRADDDGSRRLLIMRGSSVSSATVPADISPAASPSSSPVKQAPEGAAPVDKEGDKQQHRKDDAILAVMSFVYKIEHGVLISAVDELRVSDRVRRRGVGKFMLFVGEMLAKKAGMNGIMVSVRR
jgi:hypothetical protein